MTYDYAVTLDAERGECDCPDAMESTVWRHMVAVALVAGGADDGDDTGEQDLSAYLRDLSPGELVDLGLDAAANNEALEQRLLLRAAESRLRKGVTAPGRGRARRGQSRQ
jgi:hypothetical protein